MTTCSDLAEYEWLTGSEAGALLEEVAADKAPLHRAVERLRGRLTQSQTHLLIEQVELRRRAAAKFSQAHRMFFTRIGLEQATDEWVAAYKASRFGAHQTVADLCCGIGGDLKTLAANCQAIGVDRDRVATHFAAVNTGAVVSAIDIADFQPDGVAAIHIDPDRRPAGRRTTSLDYCQPNLAMIERLLSRVANTGVKLAAACEVPTEWAAHCELEWISSNRECRQLVAWHGELATATGKRRATILSAACCSSPRTIIGQAKQPVTTVEQPDLFVFDIDPAVLAAKLKGVLATEHQLNALSNGPTYLTGPRAIADAALACFEVDDVVPLHVRKLSQLLRSRGIGQLEIKKRGIEMDPEQLRKELRLQGENSATLLITRVAGRPTAILAHRIQEKA